MLFHGQESFIVSFPYRNLSYAGLSWLMLTAFATSFASPLQDELVTSPEKSGETTAEVPPVATAELNRALVERFPRKLFDAGEAIGNLPEVQRSLLDKILLQVYASEFQGRSSDTVLTDQAMRSAFTAACEKQWSEAWTTEAGTPETIEPSVWVWRLLSLRKAGHLPKTKDRGPRVVLSAGQQLWAEIASRRSEEWYEASLDRVLADQQGREFFAAMVQQMKLDADLDLIRHAALTLRKTRRLRPELSAKLVDWPIEQLSFRVEALRAVLEQIPEQPGAYLFRDGTGYLYIGEAKNLRTRLTQHLEDSDRESLAKYLESPDAQQIVVDLHVFPADSPGRQLAVRRAYESELIRSRSPRFNLRP